LSIDSNRLADTTLALGKSNAPVFTWPKGCWSQIESYISQYSNVIFSHGICPDFVDTFYGGENWYK